MLSISTLGFTLSCPNFFLPLLPSHPTNLFTRSLMVSSKIISEYAKSSRSSCKKCSKPISAGTLRLGSVTRDARGFDMTKWHHFKCLTIKSVENINGFSSLKAADQEALKNLAKESKVRKADDIDEGGKTKEESAKKKSKVLKDNDDIEEGGKTKEESAKKKSKVLKDDEDVKPVAEIEIVFTDSDAKSDYKGVVLMPNWKSFQTVIFLEKEEGLKDSSKIAAFDFDGCLAKTSLKEVGAGAWSLMHLDIPEKLKKLYEDGYKVVIFTNEANIDRWKNKRELAIDSKIGRLNNFIKRVEVPVQVFIACGHGGEDGYRKPKPGMWRLMEKYFNSGIEIDMEESFYVGDAAGRNKDHGDADIKFAQAIGLKFYVPEDYFGV